MRTIWSDAPTEVPAHSVKIGQTGRLFKPDHEYGADMRQPHGRRWRGSTVTTSKRPDLIQRVHDSNRTSHGATREAQPASERCSCRQVSERIEKATQERDWTRQIAGRYEAPKTNLRVQSAAAQ